MLVAVLAHDLSAGMKFVHGSSEKLLLDVGVTIGSLAEYAFVGVDLRDQGVHGVPLVSGQFREAGYRVQHFACQPNFIGHKSTVRSSIGSSDRRTSLFRIAVDPRVDY